MARVREGPTREQLRVMRLEGGPARVLAGAGSGKTYTMTGLIRNQVENYLRGYGGTAPERVLALTFTVKAAEEMRSRLMGALGEQALKLTVSNFHSHALQIVRENASLLGVEAEAPVLRRGRAWLMVLEELEAEDLSLRRLELANPATAADRVLGLLSNARNDLVDLQTIRERTEQDLQHPDATVEMRRCFEERLDLIELAGRFERRRRERGLLRYEDMISLAVEILADPVRGESYRGRYELVVVDEFQDTNPAQMRFVEHLADGDHSRVIVIGDDLQSIYNFTGASIRNIQRFEERAGVPVGSNTHSLATNFRSGSRIVRLANHVAREVHPRNSPDEPKMLRAHEDAPEGEIRAFVAASDAAEGREISCRIRALLEDGAAPGSCAVLIRRWSQAAPVLAALSEAGVPCEVAEGGDLLTRPEITLVSDYLRLVARPDEALGSLVRILSRQPVILGPDDLRLVFEAPGGHEAALAAPEDVPGLSDAARERLERFSRTLGELEKELAHAGSLGAFVERTIEVTGVGHELRSTPSPEARLALQFLGLFRDLAGEFGDVGAMEEFVRYLEVMGDSASTENAAPPSEHADAVRVMTVHRAKGLEFDHVFVPGLSRDLFPYNRRPESALEKAHALPTVLELDPDPEAVAAYKAMDARAVKETLEREAREEEGRLFYVAVTRARRSLTVSRAHYYLNNKRPKKPGIFWELLEDAGETVPISFAPEPEVPEGNPGIEEKSSRKERSADRWPLEAAAPGTDAEVAARLGVSGWEEELEGLKRDARAIPGLPRPAHVLPVPEVHSPGSLMDFETCPRRYYYTHVFPVPLLEDGSAAQDRRAAPRPWIEGGMRSAPPGKRGEAGERPDTPFRGTEYGERVVRYPLHDGPEPPGTGPVRMVEVPFVLPVRDTEIRGRMDAVLVDGDGTFHILGWKTGRPSKRYADSLQLPVCALAANRLWGIAPERIRLAYVLVPGGEIAEVHIEDGFLERAEERVHGAIARIGRGAFEPKPSRYGCSRCPVVGVGMAGCPENVPPDEGSR